MGGSSLFAQRAALARVAAATCLAAGLQMGNAAAAAPTPPDTFTAVTAEMTPADVSLRIAVRAWSDDAARAEVLRALASEEPSKALAALPTVGYVWPSGSPVGYSIKYSHRQSTSGGERLTFVTDQRLGRYDSQPWIAAGADGAEERAYSVIELDLDSQGNGTGMLSLAADVKLDQSASLVTLSREGTTQLLRNVAVEPKPYWAKVP